MEPDYDESKLRQSRRISEHVKYLSDTVYDRWKNRHELRQRELKDAEVIERSREIFYDTDRILEAQTQQFKVCENCSGLNTISSQSSTGYNIFAITIPRDACSKCIDEGYRLYRNTPSGNYSHIYLQDRVNDEFKTR